VKASLSSIQSAIDNYGWSGIAAAINVAVLRFLVALPLAVMVLGPTGEISGMCQDTASGDSIPALHQGVGGSPRVWTILSRVGDKYTKLKSYHFTGTQQMTIKVHGSEYRFTSSVENASAGTPETTGSRFEAGKMVKIAGSGPTSPGLTFGMPGPGLYRFDKLPENVKSPSLLREGSVFANGKNNSCYIIQIHWRPEQGEPEICVGNLETLWVDKLSYLVLRTGFSKFNDVDRPNPHLMERWVVTFNSYELNGPVPEWLKNVKQQSEEQDRALSARMTGKVAPGFSLKDLDGNSLSLENLRGKTVLLDFWATWCGPCKREEAELEKLEKEQGRSSLAVVRITNQAAELVKAFLRRTGENFPSLVDGESATRNYEVRGVPTLVLVDKTGRIAAYYVGFLDENQLRAELEKAGMPAERLP